jgi:D-alanine-D-alanine ligase
MGAHQSDRRRHAARVASDATSTDPIVVLVPESASIDPSLAYYTDYSQSHEELARAFAALRRTWRWVPVTRDGAADTIAELARDAVAAGASLPLVVNLCDGDESNDVPGVAVIEALEAGGFSYTGADADFYRLTTSKLPMKAAFDAHGVPTAPWRAFTDADDCAALLAQVGTPAIVKPAVSAGSMGVTTASVVHNADALRAQAATLRDGYLGWNLLSDGILVERFVSGREFTMLIVGDAGAPADARCYAPVERVFNALLPPTEQFLSYDRLWEVYEREAPMPDGGYLWEYAPVRGPLAEQIRAVSWAAYEAVGGHGYGRVDVRQCAESGALYVLEVNAQCALSEDEDYTSVGAILKAEGMSFADLIADILTQVEVLR